MTAISSVVLASAIVLLAFVQLSSSRHFRGGLISWRPSPGDPANTVFFSFKMAWNLSEYECTTALIAPEGDWYCLKGCDSVRPVASTAIRCTGFSIKNEWMSGENTFKYNFPSAGPFVVSFAGGAWTKLVKGGGSWELPTTIDLRPRKDNGRINSSPLSGTSPIISLLQRCSYRLHIHHDDPDGDEVRCRWAEIRQENTIFKGTAFDGYKTNECSGVCHGVPNATLERNPCVINFEPSVVGWYAVALMLEDFLSPTDTLPLSQVPLQFMFQVHAREDSESAIPCGTSLTFTDETLKDGQCVVITEGSTFDSSIVLNERPEIARLSEVALVAPTGLSKSGISDYGLNLIKQRGVRVMWTPTPEQYGKHSFCFYALDDAGIATEQRCVTLLAGAKRPTILVDTRYPLGSELSPYDTNFEVKFDQQIARPSSTKYISVFKEGEDSSPPAQFDTSDDKQVSLAGNALSFILNDGQFEYDSAYYVTIEAGAVLGIQNCGGDAYTVFAGLTGKNGWNFKTGVLEIIDRPSGIRTETVGDVVSIGGSGKAGLSAGNQAVIDCYVKGSPAPSIRLFHEGRLVKAEENATNVQIVLKTVTESDAGTYRCEANNSIGVDVRNRTIHVNVSPRIVTAGENSIAGVGSKVSLKCRATGNPSPTLVWAFDGSPVTSQSGVSVNSDGTELVIDIATKDHEGIYTCTATNIIGSDVQQSSLQLSQCRSNLTMLEVPDCLVTVILADESRTWTGNYKYLEDVSLELDKQLQAAGVGIGRRPNQYAVVGFGTDAMQAHIISVNSRKLFPVSKVSKAVRSLRSDGDRPDGFHAIKYALEHLPLHQGSAKQCALHILIATQEHSMKALRRDVTREQVNSLLCRNGPVLVTALLGGAFVVGSEKMPAFGVDSTLLAYLSNNGGVRKVQDEVQLQQVAYSVCNAFRDYGDMALRHHGSVWDLYHFMTTLAVRNAVNIRAMAGATVTSLVNNFRPCKDCVCKLEDGEEEEVASCRIVNRPYYCNCRREGSPENECTALVNRACSENVFATSSTADPLTILPSECISQLEG